VVLADRDGARAEEIAAEPIDLALGRLLRSVGVSDRDIAIVVGRLGWGEGGPHTLQEIGDAFRMSRERIRQIERRVTERIGRTYLPQIERAVELLTERAPLRPDQAAQLLVREGLTTVPLHLAGLAVAATLLGYEVTFHMDTGDGAGYVLAQGVTGTGPVFAVARREAGRVGVSNIEEVHAELEARGQRFSGRRGLPDPAFVRPRPFPSRGLVLDARVLPRTATDCAMSPSACSR